MLTQPGKVTHLILGRSIAVETLFKPAAGVDLCPPTQHRDLIEGKTQQDPVVLKVMARFIIASDSGVKVQRQTMQPAALVVDGIRGEGQFRQPLQRPKTSALCLMA